MSIPRIKLLFVCVAGNAVGYGHLSRCLAIAAQALLETASVTFLVFGDNDARDRVAEVGYSCTVRPLSELNHLAAGSQLAESPDGIVDAVLVDLAYPGFFSQVDNPQFLFSSLQTFGRVLVTIDTLGDQSLVMQMPEVDVALMVIPYVAQVLAPPIANYRLLKGAKFALLAPEYAALPPRVQRASASRVLISCGGSDPGQFTLQVLQGLELVATRLSIRIVIGPMFSAELRAKISEMAGVSLHSVEQIQAPESLLCDMLWCDLAIAASGLTKYELAASATPALLFSIDEFHERVNRPFAGAGSVLDMGVGVSPVMVAQHTEYLLKDVQARAKMAVNGRQLVDGRGSQRLLAEIRRVCLAEE